VTNICDQAILLRRFPYSESSLVTRVFTRQHGKLGLLARGAYRPKSRFYCVLDHFDTLELEWLEQRGRELQDLREGDIHTRRLKISSDLESYRAGALVCELIDLTSPLGQRDVGMWRRLTLCLDELNSGSRPAWEAAVCFELGLLEEHGLCPALELCASCGLEASPPDPNEPRACFSASCGGRLCAACGRDARDAGRRVGTMPLDVLEAASLLLRGAREGVRISPLAPALLLRLRDFVDRFMDHHLEVRAKARGDFLSKADRNSRTALSATSLRT
jgi:DNA repair protein RecO (recombination protein O)